MSANSPLRSPSVSTPSTSASSPTRTVHRQQRNEKRNRTGCWPCKSKHVRCEEQRPECARCKRLGLDCSYERKLTWEEDAKRKGICLGREGTYSRYGRTAAKKEVPHVFAGTYTGQHYFLHTAQEHFTSDTVATRDDLEEVESQFPGGLVLAQSLEAKHSKEELFLHEYFEQAILPLCVLDRGDPASNSYYRCIIPMSQCYEPLRHAILAVSATQLPPQYLNKYKEAGIGYYQKAIEGLRRTAKAIDDDQEQTSWKYIATMVMMCFHDISISCNGSWMHHLREGIRRMASIKSVKGEELMLQKFFHMYFQAHRIMSYTENYDQTDSSVYEVQWFPDENLQEIDLLMGCSRELLNCVDDTSRLASRIHQALKNNTPNRESWTKQRDHLEQRIKDLNQIAPIPCANPEEVHHIAGVKKLTALLFLHERVTSHLPNRGRSAHATELANEIISQISPLKNYATLLWPLFVVGRASKENEHHRRFVLDKLGKLIEERSLCSLQIAKKIIEDEYIKADLGMKRSCLSDGPKWWATLEGKWISLA